MVKKFTCDIFRTLSCTNPFGGRDGMHKLFKFMRLERCLSNDRSGIKQIVQKVLRGDVKDIVVMAGAGISTPCGMPDFRTPGTGLYDNLQEFNLPYPTAVFDLSYFQKNPVPFFKLAKVLYPGNYPPSYVHHFFHFLDQKGLLRRVYTQNIDGLEKIAGLRDEKLVEAHGSFHSATCMLCRRKYDGLAVKEIGMRDLIPYCLHSGCKGIIKPDIVFFGENLPERFFRYPEDFHACDLLLVMGTSLEVYPFAGLADQARDGVPRLLINREIVEPFLGHRKRQEDVVYQGDVVEGTAHLVDALGWSQEMADLTRKAS